MSVEKETTAKSTQLNEDVENEGLNSRRKTFDNPEKNSGVIYLSTVPPRFTKRRIQEYFTHFGEVGRIYLQVDKRAKSRRYVEGWVEFKKKKIAKRVSALLNGTQVGGKHRSPAFDSLWSIKYLNGFKWSNLLEQLTYERTVEEQRLRVELSQARREAKHFVDQAERGGKLRQMEKKMVEKGGEWIKTQKQKVAVKKNPKKKKNPNESGNEELFNMIFH